MTALLRKFHATLIAFLTMGTVAFADTAPPLSEERVKELALEAILENPAVIEEAIQRLQQLQQERQQAGIKATLEARRSDLENDPNAPVLGNPDGDVTLVEFFDYNCPYCKRAKPELEALLESDPNVRLVFREWPILSAGSMFAARAALAARKQGKYEEFHWALMGFKGRIEETSTLDIAAEIGLDIDRLKADMEEPSVTEHIQLSMQLAQELNITGTPSFVVGDVVLPGLLTRDQLAAAVADNR
jgi:protein-disulfide isomerase